MPQRDSSFSLRRFILPLALMFTAACGSQADSGATDAAPLNLADANNDFTDTLRLYYVGYPVGYEVFTVAPDGAGLVYTAELDQVDRGRRTHTGSTIRINGDHQPTLLEISQLTDTTPVLQTRIAIDHAATSSPTATVTSRGETIDVPLPPQTFPIAGLKPASQHLALLRHWLHLDQPESMNIVPGTPVNPIHIQAQGQDTFSLRGETITLHRYTVEGVVWGHASVWLDSELRLAAVLPGGGGGLTFEAVRNEIDPLFPELQAIATADRMKDLARLTEPVKTLVSGESSTPLAVINGTLIDGTGAPPIENAVIIIADGRIVAAGADVEIPADAEILDVDGRTIIPGLWDMHAHAMQVEWGPLYLAGGITSVRDMGNTLPFIVSFRDAIRAGQGLGPNFMLAGLIDGGGPNAFGAINAQTPEEGRAAVRMYDDLGFVQMKLYSLLQPDVVEAIADEAHSRGMSVTGHIPRSLTMLEAVEAGMDHVAHLPIGGDPTSDSIQALIAELARQGTVFDPMASWGEVLRRSREEPLANFQPGVNFLPPALDQRVGPWGSDADSATVHASLARGLAMIKALYDAGVPIVAGTDGGVPGFSVFREIELYAKAGFTNMEALRAATAVSAEAMGMQDEVGTIEAGKRADLLVLDANPLDDITNIRTGSLVIINGAAYQTEDLWRAIGFGIPE